MRRTALLLALAGIAALLPPPSVAEAGVVYPLVFPVAGDNHYTDTFGAPRSGGRTHAGTDIMAEKMVPVVAAASGTVGWMHDERGGNCCAMALEHDDGWATWYIHLNNDTPGTDDGQGWGFAPGIERGVHVERGQLIGYVGDSGNAEWTGSHLHFELHDQHGTPVNPYDSLLAALPARGQSDGRPWCSVDGDEREDVTVGAPSHSGGGGIAVIEGTPSGFDPATVSWEATAQSGEGGSSVACGDFDGDGDGDLVVGIPGADRRSGAIEVNVMQGGAVTERLVWTGRDLPGAAERGDALPSALAAGDFNGDGFDDLAIGVSGEDFGTKVDVGNVIVVPGGNLGLDVTAASSLSQASRGIAGAAEADDRFAEALAAGDLNADGYDDLVVGVPGEDVGTRVDVGAVHVLFGGVEGLGGADRLLHQSVRGVAGAGEADDRFGAAVAVGDVTGDGFADIVVGVPGEDLRTPVDAGAIHLLLGSSAGVTVSGDQLLSESSAGVEGKGETGDGFGSAVAVGDVDGDGKADAIVGVPAEGIGSARGAGSVHVLFGTSSGLSVTDDLHINFSHVGSSATPGDGLGAHVAGFDVDGDGRQELAVGAPGFDGAGGSDAGVLMVWRVSRSGVTMLASTDGAGAPPAGAAAGVVSR